MTVFKHLFIATSYVLFAVAVALVLPTVVVTVDSQWAIVAAGFVLVSSALMHESMARGEHNDIASEQYDALSRGYERLREELIAMAEESSLLHKALRAKSKEKKSSANLNKVVAEVQVLQSLIEQISQNRDVEATGPAGPKVPPRDVSRDVPRDVPVANGAAAPGAGFEVLETNQLSPFNDAQVLEIIHEALRSDRVEMFLQPVVSLPQRKPRFYECYTRIRDADGNMIMPQQYIPIAEREGLVGAIDNLLLFRCVQLVRKSQSNSHNISFFCNISSRTLKDKAFFKEFIQFMVANSELSRNLIFEFSQADFESLWLDMEPDLEQLARLGYVFSMDRVTDLDLDSTILAQRNVKFVKVDIKDLLAIRWPEPVASARQKAEAATEIDAGGEARAEARGEVEAEVEGEDSAEDAPAPRIVIPPIDPMPPLVDMEGLRQELDRANIDLIVEKVESENDLIEMLEYRIDFGQGYLFGEPYPSRGD